MIRRHGLTTPTLISTLVGASAGAVAGLVAASLQTRHEPTVAVVDPLAFPIIVPIDDPAGRVGAAGATHPAIPQMAGGWLIVPLENAGLGPAINLQATVAMASEVHLAAAIGVIASGRRAALHFAAAGPLCDFALQLTYRDYRARPRHLSARWSLEDRIYVLDW